MMLEHCGPSRFVGRSAAGRPPAHEGRIAPRARGVERGAGLRHRGPLPPPRLPPPPGHGRGRSRDVPLAPRPLRPGQRLHARPLGRRCGRLRRGRGRRRRAGRRPAGDRSRRPAPAAPARRARAGHHPGHGQGHARASGGRRAGADRGRGARLRHGLSRTQGGGPGSPCSWPWPTCCPRSTRPTGRWPSSTRWPSSAGTRGAARPASRSRRSATAATTSSRSAAGTGASWRPGRRTRPSGRWPRSSSAGDLAAAERVMFAADDRPRVHRRGPHARLHQQGLRGASRWSGPSTPAS